MAEALHSDWRGWGFESLAGYMAKGGTTHLDTKGDGCFPFILAIVVIGLFVILFVI